MANSEQMGFGFEQIEEEKATAHLPSDMEAGIAAYRVMLEKNNQAMLAGDETAAMAIRKEANRLAVKLNNGEAGILGGPDAPRPVTPRKSSIKTRTASSSSVRPASRQLNWRGARRRPVQATGQRFAFDCVIQRGWSSGFIRDDRVEEDVAPVGERRGTCGSQPAVHSCLESLRVSGSQLGAEPSHSQ